MIIKISILRLLVSFFAFFCFPIFFYFVGYGMYFWVADVVPIGPAGTARGDEGAIDVFGIGPFIIIILSFAASVLTYAATFRENWTLSFVTKSLLFLVFSIVSTANYAHGDLILGKEPQAILNIAMIGVSIGIVFIIQKYVSRCKDEVAYFSFLFLLLLIVYAFIAVPMWYTISFLSWKLGAGSLASLDSSAKALGAVASLVAVFGLEWKSGRLTRKQD
jgi:hypothetical protein